MLEVVSSTRFKPNPIAFPIVELMDPVLMEIAFFGRAVVVTILAGTKMRGVLATKITSSVTTGENGGDQVEGYCVTMN